MPRAITPQEALIYTMVTMSAVDRKMSENELARIGEIVKYSPIFADFQKDRLVKTAEACGNILSEGGSLDMLLADIADALPNKLRETAYAFAVEVAAADVAVAVEEIRLLEMLRDALRLDKLTTSALERSARARYQTL